MTKFLNTSGAYAQIEEIVSKSQGKLVLITPFVKMPQPLLERIRDRANLNRTVETLNGSLNYHKACLLRLHFFNKLNKLFPLPLK